MGIVFACVCLRVCVRLRGRPSTSSLFGEGPYFWGRLTLTFKVKFNLKSHIYPILACPCHNSPFVQARITKLGQKTQTKLLMVPIVLWAIDLHCQILLVKRLIKLSMGEDRERCYTRDRHPIPSRTVAPRWFYCSVNPLDLKELYLHLRPPCCARTQSTVFDLITSKVRYCLWIRAELFTSGMRASVTHVRYVYSTNQSSAGQKHGIVSSGIHAHARHATFILSTFNYCPFVWHTCNVTKTRKI